MSASKTQVDWKLDVKGPAYVDGTPKGCLRLGLGVRDYCDRHNIKPGSKLIREANLVAIDRGNKLVWLEDLMSAKGVEIREVGDIAHKTRRSQAAGRYRAEKEAREQAAAAKRADKAAKREARKAAKEAAVEA